MNKMPVCLGLSFTLELFAKANIITILNKPLSRSMRHITLVKSYFFPSVSLSPFICLLVGCLLMSAGFLLQTGSADQPLRRAAYCLGSTRIPHYPPPPHPTHTLSPPPPPHTHTIPPPPHPTHTLYPPKVSLSLIFTFPDRV